MRPTTPTLESRDELGEYIERYADRIDGELGVFLGFPYGPDEFDTVCARNARRAFRSASVVKIPILYALYERYDGRLDSLAESCPLSPENRVGGSGILHLLDATPTIEDLARAMIATSDNAATNQLIDLLSMTTVNDSAAKLGMKHTRLARKMMTTLEATDFEESGVRVPENEPANVTSPVDCARFFADIACEATLSANAYERMRVPLSAQKDTSMVPRYLPYETEIMHKTGWLPTAALDAGLLSVPEKGPPPLVFSVFVDSVSNGADAADAIAEIGDAVFSWLK
ncbi:beta-lactamase class A [Haladaptatus litoreus]|uniref:Beta-lactamase class A n=1 Tax=Haladaptatus litoreus TaxID=553468 RepID=A0A1N7B1H7_9EURY|nr:serine hydrolase [Haladaptatus litoreus]SIR45142.1 beta-lactamase class A [Haladaptatus litoreus]